MSEREYQIVCEKMEREINILNHRNNSLMKLCRKLQEYIEKHNLIERKVLIKNSNGIAIDNLNELDNITYLEIPNAVYVIDDNSIIEEVEE